jgi:hypothetical protein
MSGSGQQGVIHLASRADPHDPFPVVACVEPTAVHGFWTSALTSFRERLRISQHPVHIVRSRAVA